MKKFRAFCQKHPLELLHRDIQKNPLGYDLYVTTCPLCLVGPAALGEGVRPVQKWWVMPLERSTSRENILDLAKREQAQCMVTWEDYFGLLARLDECHKLRQQILRDLFHGAALHPEGKP